MRSTDYGTRVGMHCSQQAVASFPKQSVRIVDTLPHDVRCRLLLGSCGRIVVYEAAAPVIPVFLPVTVRAKGRADHFDGRSARRERRRVAEIARPDGVHGGDLNVIRCAVV